MKAELDKARAAQQTCVQDNAVLSARVAELEENYFDGLILTFFDNQFEYRVNKAALSDFNKGKVYKSLYDSAFAEAMETFNGGTGGDRVMFDLMNQIDSSDDNLVDEGEAKAFRDAEEKAYKNSSKAPTE